MDLWRGLLDVPAAAAVLSCVKVSMPATDDELDARVTYGLGRLWLEDADAVLLLGDADSGSFLVPRVRGLEQAFKTFVGRESMSARAAGKSRSLASNGTGCVSRAFARGHFGGLERVARYAKPLLLRVNRWWTAAGSNR